MKMCMSICVVVQPNVVNYKILHFGHFLQADILRSQPQPVDVFYASQVYLTKCCVFGFDVMCGAMQLILFLCARSKKLYAHKENKFE